MSMSPKQCEEFWAMADKNGDGELSIQELAASLRKYDPTLTDRQISNIFIGIDKDGDCLITKREFMSEMAEKPKRMDSITSLFRKYDADNSGSLNQEESKKLIADIFGPEQADKILPKFMKYSDSSGDGLVSLDEFKQFFA